MNALYSDKLGKLTKRQLAELIMTAQYCQQAAVDPMALSITDPEETAIQHENCRALANTAAEIEAMARQMMVEKFIDPRDQDNERAVEYAVNEELPADWQPDLTILDCLTDDECRMHTEQPLDKIERRLDADDRILRTVIV